jgi:hypothetical protein
MKRRRRQAFAPVGRGSSLSKHPHPTLPAGGREVKRSVRWPPGIRFPGSRLEPLETPPPDPPRRGEGGQAECAMAARHSLPWLAARASRNTPTRPSPQGGGRSSGVCDGRQALASLARGSSLSKHPHPALPAGGREIKRSVRCPSGVRSVGRGSSISKHPHPTLPAGGREVKRSVRWPPGIRFPGSRLQPLEIPPPNPAHAGNPATLTTVAPRMGEGE